jgi:hypothetical protein
VNEIISIGGWRNFYRHALGDWPGGAAGLGALCDYLVSKKDLVWTGTLRDVAQYIYERDSAKVQAVSVTQSQIVLNLTHSLDTAVCNFTFPLTLKTEVLATWDSVTVLQGSRPTVVKSVNESGKQYVYCNAQPNKGQITLRDGGPTAITDRLPIHSGLVSNKMEPAVFPNPIQAEILYRYLETNKKVTACDLTGKVVARGMLGRSGFYLMEEAGKKAIRKVLVIK